MGDASIKAVRAREVLDCRGDPTLEVEIRTQDGSVGMADVPVGRSTGKYEAFELRDGDPRYYRGRGVRKAVKIVNEVIGPKMVGRDSVQQSDNDSLMIEFDGTENKSRLGGNSIVGVSLAMAKAAAASLRKPLYEHLGGETASVLPVPTLDMIEGGTLAATELDFQEHQVVPVGARSFSEAIRMGAEVYHELGKILAKKWGRHSLNVGVEGGYTPPGMKDPRQAFDAELSAIDELGYSKKFVLSIDAAASHLYDPRARKYTFMGKKLEPGELADLYDDLTSAYPIRSIEDPLEQDDLEGFAELTRRLKIQIIGDDLFVTNAKRLKKGIGVKAANAMLLKVNQVGTLTEALEAARVARKGGYAIQVSERSGQTEDTWLADLTVAINAGQIKTGCPCRGERTAQYNRLLRIEEELAGKAIYPGRDIYRRTPQPTVRTSVLSGRKAAMN